MVFFNLFFFFKSNIHFSSTGSCILSTPKYLQLSLKYMVLIKVTKPKSYRKRNGYLTISNKTCPLRKSIH